MAIRQTVDFTEVEEELMSKIGALGLEISFDEEDTKTNEPKDEDVDEEN